ncbi:hypothetical protein [Singulisphaera sp. PoT]|uniref:hypothetical protein n=1 Tax=Singulisphaera sp. PoT TaxID=3411797 RepID=UPI003BF5E43F
MVATAKGLERSALKALALALGIWGTSGSTASATHPGGHDGIGLWGDYGYGPHLGETCGIAYGKPFYGGYGMAYGYPKHRPSPGCGVPTYGSYGQGCGPSPTAEGFAAPHYGSFGNYTGAPPAPVLTSLVAAEAESKSLQNSTPPREIPLIERELPPRLPMPTPDDPEIPRARPLPEPDGLDRSRPSDTVQRGKWKAAGGTQRVAGGGPSPTGGR